MSLSWITRSSTSKAYPYEVIDSIREIRVYWYGERGYELLARDLPSIKAAQAWAERHWRAQKDLSMRVVNQHNVRGL